MATCSKEAVGWNVPRVYVNYLRAEPQNRPKHIKLMKVFHYIANGVCLSRTKILLIHAYANVVQWKLPIKYF